MVIRWCLGAMQDLSSDNRMAADGEPRASPRECPECGEVLLHTNGCVLCGHCGYSPCD